MSDYGLTCKNGEYNNLWIEKFAKMASKKLKNWTEIRFDEDGKCLAYTHKPHRETSWWVARNGKSWYVTHPDGFDFIGSGIDWETFGIIRTTEAKPKRGKKAEQIKLLAKYAAELGSELSATRAMLAESQRELEEVKAGLDLLAGWNDAERVDFMGLGFLEGIPSIAEKLGNTEQIQRSWFSDGWYSGANAMLDAAQGIESVSIGEFNSGKVDIEAVTGAARVVGAVQNALATGMLTGEGK